MQCILSTSPPLSHSLDFVIKFLNKLNIII